MIRKCKCGCGGDTKSTYCPGHYPRTARFKVKLSKIHSQPEVSLRHSLAGKRYYAEHPEAKEILRENGRKTRAILVADGRIGWPKGVLHTADHNVKNGLGVKLAIKEGRFDPGQNMRNFIAAGASEEYLNSRGHRGVQGMFYSHKNGTQFRYDSSWELTRMQVLEGSDAVLSYKKNPVHIPYRVGGQTHYYWPDFLVEYVDGHSVIEEIKPKTLSKLPVAKAKIRVARAFCQTTGLTFRLISDQAQLTLV